MREDDEPGEPGRHHIRNTEETLVRTTLLTISVIAAGALLVGCDWGGDDEIERQMPQAGEYGADGTAEYGAGETRTHGGEQAGEYDAAGPRYGEESERRAAGETQGMRNNELRIVADAKAATKPHQKQQGQDQGVTHEMAGSQFSDDDAVEVTVDLRNGQQGQKVELAVYDAHTNAEVWSEQKDVQQARSELQFTIDAQELEQGNYRAEVKVADQTVGNKDFQVVKKGRRQVAAR
jgi:hypothetical protein